MPYPIFIIIICFCSILSACSFGGDITPEAKSPSVTPSKTYVSTLSSDERIKLAKERKSYISGIRKGDFYSLRNAPEEALSYYMSVQEKLPNDQVVRKKTAHVYFLLKNWSQAYQQYIQVPLSELAASEKDELLDALFFDETIFDRLGELQKLSISSGALEYYQTVDACYGGIHNCIVKIAAYSGANDRINDLNVQIKNAEKISSDYQYRNLLVAAKFYEQGMYRAVEKLTREILRERPDYIEVKKILGFSLFELGKYEESKKLLLEYLELNPRDLDSITRLGEIYYHLGDYISSNLYLNNAIIAGFTPKTNIERRLAYNYSMLGDIVGMMKVLGYLLKEEDVTEEDFAVAISMAIREGEYDQAESWASAGREKFPESHHIMPLYIQILRLDGQLDNASSLIQNTPEEAMIENPNYLLEKAIILYELQDRESARKLFEELLELDDWPNIVDESRRYLSDIDASSP